MTKYLYCFVVFLLFCWSGKAQQAASDTTLLIDSVVFQFVNPVAAYSSNIPTVFETGHWGYLDASLAFQHTSRLNNLKNWQNPDFNLLSYFGLGNPNKWVGIGIGINLMGLSNTEGAKNNLGESAIEFHLSRKITKNIHFGTGVFNAIQINPTPINTLRTYYAQVGGFIPLKKDNSSAFSTLFFNLGAGNGKFQPRDTFLARINSVIRMYGSVGLQVLPRANFIVEWSGVELAIGGAIFPFKKNNFHISSFISDINFFKRRWIVIAGYNHIFRKEQYLRSTGVRNIKNHMVMPQ